MIKQGKSSIVSLSQNKAADAVENLVLIKCLSLIPIINRDAGGDGPRGGYFRLVK